MRLGCKNVNSLSLYNPKGSKMCKLINIHQKYQTDGACIVEHGINFRMSSNGNCPSDLFSGIRGSRVSAAHNVHETHGRYQQGGTMNVAFSRLASYVKDTGVDHRGLGQWSWIQVGTGEHRTWIVSAYQPGKTAPSITWTAGDQGNMKGQGTVAAQHQWYFRRKSNFNHPRKVFGKQLITQLKAW